MRLLEKIRSLPERTRKIILWVVLIILALIMLNWWFGRFSKKMDNLQAGQFIEQLKPPKFEMPKTDAQ